MHSNPAEIGERIKAARKAAHLSQTELAQRLDKTMRTVQKYESGEIEPSIAMINRQNLKHISGRPDWLSETRNPAGQPV